MIIKPGLRDFFWIAAGAVIMLALMLIFMHFQQEQSPVAQLAFKAKRIELAGQMRLALALASEAGNSAVMATTDRDSHNFADQARAATKTVERDLRELTELLHKGGAKNEEELLAGFSQTFTDLQRIDKDLLNLAVQNTNLKAYRLAFGPAEDVLKEMDSLLLHIAEKAAGSSKSSCPVRQLADEIRIGALRIQTMLPPHIAEESSQKMDKLEALIANEDRNIRKNLEDLTGLLKSSGDSSDVEAITARYARFREIKAQIIKLSRENTNVRSLSIALNEKRKIMLAGQDTLASLVQAIQQEPVAGVTYGVPTNPR
jgi:hypothetical protein